MGRCGGGLAPCSERHVWCNNASHTFAIDVNYIKLFKSLPNFFDDCVGVKYQKIEILKSGSGNFNKTVIRVQSGLFKMC